MNKRIGLPISVIVLLTVYYESDCKMIQVPRGTTAKVNQSTYFNCSTDLVAKDIFWMHDDKHVYTGNGIYEEYRGRVTIDVDNDTGACNLVIHSVQPSDAGEYMCAEDEGTGEQRSAQLIVIDDDPICQSNVNLNDIVGQNACHLKKDEVELSCSVTFHGNVPPRMEWRKTSDGIGITGVTSNMTNANRHNSTLILGNDISLHESAYICQIRGITENEYKCTSEVIRLSYSVESVDVIPTVRGTHLTCVANTTFNCKYRWFHGNDSVCPISCHQNVTAHFLGDYHCEAKCFVRGKDCTFVAMRVFVTPEPEPVVERISGFPALIIIVLGTGLLGAVGVIIILCLKPRNKPRTIEEAIKLIVLSSDVLDHANAEEKEAYVKKTGQDPSAKKLISHKTIETLKELHLHLMFPIPGTSLMKNNEDSIKHSENCETEAKGEDASDNDYTFSVNISRDGENDGEDKVMDETGTVTER